MRPATTKFSTTAPRVYHGSRFSARPTAGLYTQRFGTLGLTDRHAPLRLWDPTLLDRLTVPLSRVRE